MTWLTRLQDCPVFRVRAGETNKFVLLCDPATHGGACLQVIEIFDVGGATPPNSHAAAVESFVVLHGQGVAQCNGQVMALQRGSVLIVSPGEVHVVRNTGQDRLYCLTTLMPDEELGGLIRQGVPDRLDATDWSVLLGA
jgi:mannose-6-phosphate isomerase-like protein (cupin superfamily)